MSFFTDRTNIRYSGVNCALGPSKSIRYRGDFIIAGFVIAGFVSPYFTVIIIVCYDGVFVMYRLLHGECTRTVFTHELSATSL